LATDDDVSTYAIHLMFGKRFADIVVLKVGC